MDNKEIIKKIKELRAEKGYSLSQLSNITGLSKGFLSKIENGVSVPTVTTLRRIANALGVDLTTFFMNNDLRDINRKIVVVRKNEREKIDAEFQTSGITRWPLADKKIGRNLDPFIIELPHDHDQVYQFEGEEFFLILEGTVELNYGGESYILEEGDCVYFDGDIPYTGRSLSESPAKILMIHYEYKRVSGDPFSRAALTNRNHK